MDFVQEILGADYYFHHSFNQNPSARLFKPHTHDAFEIYVFISGGGKINVEGKFYTLSPWDLFIISPGQFHLALTEEDIPYERKVLRFDYSFIRSADPGDVLINRLPAAAFFKGSSLSKTRVPKIFERINEIFDCDEPIQRVALNGVLIDLLFCLSKMATSDFTKSESDSPHKISDVIAYINENLDKELSLDSIAKEFFISKFYLSRLFKETTGSTIGHFILMKRLNFAKRLLYGGTTPINACFLSGFTDYSSFYKSYKKYFGVSPSTTSKS